MLHPHSRTFWCQLTNVVQETLSCCFTGCLCVALCNGEAGGYVLSCYQTSPRARFFHYWSATFIRGKMYPRVNWASCHYEWLCVEQCSDAPVNWFRKRCPHVLCWRSPSYSWDWVITARSPMTWSHCCNLRAKKYIHFFEDQSCWYLWVDVWAGSFRT